MELAGSIMMIALLPELSDAGWSKHCEALAKSIDARPSGARIGVFYHVEASYSRQRALEVANVLKPRATKLRETTAGFVYCTSSAMARVAVRFVFTVAPPPYPHSIVRTVAHGYDYLARTLAIADASPYVTWHQDLIASLGTASRDATRSSL
jgi:hypothetical protein